MEFQREKFISSAKAFWLKYEPKIALGIGLVLVATISFEFGLIQGKKSQDRPLIIEKSALSQNADTQAASASTPQAQKTTQETQLAVTGSNDPSTKIGVNCAFVGSKNSDKYHVPTCRFAKLIKPENIICFKSAEEAISQGRVGDKSCVK